MRVATVTMKNEGGEKLLHAIRQVLEGKTYVSDTVSRRIVDAFAGRRKEVTTSSLGRLTDREFEVFNFIGQGMTTSEIGRHLHMSGRTVETHRLHIREKLHLKTGPELLRYAVRWAGAQELL